MSFTSAIFQGEVYHERFEPTRHKFTYDIMAFWLNLDEVEQLDNQIRGFSNEQFNWVSFRRSDFLKNASMPLKQEALQTMSELAGTPLSGEVFLLSPLRVLGMYFSPVNFYYLKSGKGVFTHLLAEVSNTPWNERHCYLVDLFNPSETQKQFHVSPFNPIDMTYRWHVPQPSERLNLRLDCCKGSKHFTAAVALEKEVMSSRSLLKTLLKIPSITIKTVWGIYWQALKLFIKKTPIYDHPGTDKSEQST